MTNLDMLLLKGASSGNPEEGLQELRYTILTKGIPANSGGMVSLARNSLALKIRPRMLQTHAVHNPPNRRLTLCNLV